MKTATASIFLVLMSFSFSIKADSLCEQAHQTALNKCKAYQSQISASHLENLSYETRIRAANKEKARTLSFGRTCAKAQSACSKTCAPDIEKAILTGGDWGHFSDLSSDCREGEVAQHRRELTRRYRAFENMTANKIVQNERRGSHMPGRSFDVLVGN